MDSLLSGSNELVYIQTDVVSVTIKGNAIHPNFQGSDYSDGSAKIEIFCDDVYELNLRNEISPSTQTKSKGTYFGSYTTKPMFFEQQRYELIIEAADGHSVSFWHDNLNIRNKITKASRHHEILSGVINFGSEIGYSDLVIKVDGKDYMRIVIEVFPTKISYREDYKAILEDVTREVYNIVFDFLKKTYLGYQQGDKVKSSPVEFFSIIDRIFNDLIKSIDAIAVRPHHELSTHHELLPSHKIKRTDKKSIRWIENHPQYAKKANGSIFAEKAMAVKKQVTYNTKENRLVKYIILSTLKKLQAFKLNYSKLLRDEDKHVVSRIDSMIQGLNRRESTSFLADIPSQESTSGMSLVFTMAPGYRELYKYYLMLLKGLSITGDVFNISIKDLALLYEYWCFIKLNSLMKDRYELVSQDVVKVQGNGIYISLVKGSGSHVKYRNRDNGEVITLSYNPKENNIPTVAQKPDNVLSLEKRGSEVQYSYIFDAKYRINPAYPGSDYKLAYNDPGPEVSDINTMHRYRDAIVYSSGASPYEQKMFGAYVLFPYKDEEKYKSHQFYKSIEKVNIGGLPFLPTATGLVESMLDDLISDSPDSAFERATLPVGIEKKLAKVDWDERDVLIGTLRRKEQLDIALKHKFYHIPVDRLDEKDFPINYVAIYQSKNIFGAQAGIRYYGKVIKCVPVKRKDIKEIPSDRDELYYRFEIKGWKELSKPIIAKELPVRSKSFTNKFLLEHSTEYPALMLSSEAEYRLYSELKRTANDIAINDDSADIGFKYDNNLIVFEDGKINVYSGKTIIASYEISEFSKRPAAMFRRLQKDVNRASN